jgi:hypothetical protein
VLKRSADLFKRFERGFLSELPLAALTRDEIEGISDGQRGPEIEAHPLMIAGCAGNLS